MEYLQTKLREAESSLSSAPSSSHAPAERDWEAFRDEAGEGEGVLELVSALRILKSAIRPGEIAGAVGTVGGALRGVVSSLAKGRKKEAVPPSRRRRGGRGGEVRKGKGNKSGGECGKRDANDVISAVESTLEKVVSSLRVVGDGLGGNEGEDSGGGKEYTTTAACTVIETLTGLVNSIYTNSQALSSAAFPAGSFGEDVMEAKDLRLGICNAVIQTLSSLDPGVPAEAGVIEGVMCHLLEGAGRALLSNGRESTAMKEASWYLIKILKEILPLYDSLIESGLGKRKRDELRGVFMSGVSGTGLARQGEGAEQSEDYMEEVLASPFTRAIWGLMGWSVFSAGGFIVDNYT